MGALLVGSPSAGGTLAAAGVIEFDGRAGGRGGDEPVHWVVSGAAVGWDSIMQGWGRGTTSRFTAAEIALAMNKAHLFAHQ